MSYLVIDNRIRTEGCELNVVHHCNLSCRACTHLSPVAARHVVDPNKVLEDFSILAKYYRPERIRLLGGEPLLHPALLEVIYAVRRSGVSDRIRVVTNGLLLPRMSDVFWQEVDEVQVSVYPGKEMSVEQLGHCQSKAKLHGGDLQLRCFDRFREAYSELGTKDKGLVRRIYNTCQAAHFWRCHNVSDGFLFRCPQSLFIPKLVNNDILAHPTIDGIKITDSPTFAGDLLAYLESPEPLASCYHCLGSVGKLFAHEQVSRRMWRLPQHYSTEELIDLEYLAALEELQPWMAELVQGKAWLAQQAANWQSLAEDREQMIRELQRIAEEREETIKQEEARIAALKALVAGYESGRVMRVLNAAERFRQRIVKRASTGTR